MVFFLLGLGLATGAELEGMQVPGDGQLQPGIPGAVEFVLFDEGEVFDGLLERAEAVGGRLISLQRFEGKPWSAMLQAEMGSSEISVDLVTNDGRSARIEFPVNDFRALGFDPPAKVDAISGQQKPYIIKLALEEPLAPEQVEVWVSEGEVLSVESTSDALIVSVKPNEARQPHMALLAIRDLRKPNSYPVWVPVRLRARPPVTVRTEPGTSLSIVLGGRRYGPLLAGKDGVLTAKVDVYPGEETATALLSDGLGNTQRTTITVAAAPDPVLGVFVEGELSPGGAVPRIHLKAISGAGADWTGDEPKCTAAGGDALEISKVAEAAWIGMLSESATRVTFDLRVDCKLGNLQESVQVPVRRGVAHRVVLQAYPQVLSADFPVAQVQAFLEDAAGDRIGSEGIFLSAVEGSLQLEEEQGGRARANYRGAPSQGQDSLTATFNRPAGVGPIWRLQSGWKLEGEYLDVAARALDRQGRPLGSQPLHLSLGDQKFTALSNARGWVQGRFRAPSVPGILRVEAESIQFNRIVLVGDSNWVDPLQADLEATQVLVFQAGRISQVFISVEPTVIFGEPGAFADVRVQLLDKGGRTVPGERIVVRVDQGVVEPPRSLADGSFLARVRPPQGMVLGELHLSAEGGEGHFSASTTLQIIPRPQRYGIGVGFGYLQGLHGVGGRAIAVDLESQLSFFDGLLQFRAGFLNWGDSTVIDDTARNRKVEVQMDNFGFGGHVLARREHGAWSNWFGLGGLIVPFRQRIRFDGEPLISGWGLNKPGIVFTGGGAFRALSGELSGEVRWIGMSGKTGDFGYEGSIGGIAIMLGYRVIL
jgi:hypothetical protein